MSLILCNGQGAVFRCEYRLAGLETVVSLAELMEEVMEVRKLTAVGND